MSSVWRFGDRAPRLTVFQLWVGIAWTIVTRGKLHSMAIILLKRQPRTSNDRIPFNIFTSCEWWSIWMVLVSDHIKLHGESFAFTILFMDISNSCASLTITVTELLISIDSNGNDSLIDLKFDDIGYELIATPPLILFIRYIRDDYRQCQIL